VTSQVRGYPFEVELPDGSPISGVILSDQVKSLDWRARHAELICRLPRPVLAAVLRLLGALLD
jgi:mRNA interferase MazF